MTAMLYQTTNHAKRATRIAVVLDTPGNAALAPPGCSPGRSRVASTVVTGFPLAMLWRRRRNLTPPGPQIDCRLPSLVSPIVSTTEDLFGDSQSLCGSKSCRKLPNSADLVSVAGKIEHGLGD